MVFPNVVDLGYMRVSDKAPSTSPNICFEGAVTLSPFFTDRF